MAMLRQLQGRQKALGEIDTPGLRFDRHKNRKTVLRLRQSLFVTQVIVQSSRHEINRDEFVLEELEVVFPFCIFLDASAGNGGRSVFRKAGRRHASLQSEV